MFYKTSSSIVLLGLLALSQGAHAQLNYADPFVSIGVFPNRSDDGGGVSASSGRVSDSAELDVMRTSSSNLPGEVHASGSADFDALRIYLEVSGSITDHIGDARSNELFTITSATAASGDAGTMHFSYTLDGSAGALDVNGSPVPGDWVFADFLIYQNFEPNGTGGTLLAQRSLELESGAVVIPGTGNGLLSVDVPFLYDVPFNLSTILRIRLMSDAEFHISSDGLTLTKIAGDVDFISADFDNSALLDSILLPDGASLSGLSGFDYSPLIDAPAAQVSAPEPIVLLGSTLLVAFLQRARARETG